MRPCGWDKKTFASQKEAPFDGCYVSGYFLEVGGPPYLALVLSTFLSSSHPLNSTPAPGMCPPCGSVPLISSPYKVRCGAGAQVKLEWDLACLAPCFEGARWDYEKHQLAESKPKVGSTVLLEAGMVSALEAKMRQTAFKRFFQVKVLSQNVMNRFQTLLYISMSTWSAPTLRSCTRTSP